MISGLRDKGEVEKMTGPDAAMTYFDYMKLAKREFQALIEKYPELSSLSAREWEVFEHLLSDKTLCPR